MGRADRIEVEAPYGLITLTKRTQQVSGPDQSGLLAGDDGKYDGAVAWRFRAQRPGQLEQHSDPRCVVVSSGMDLPLVALADAAVDTFGGLHVWVNNAGGSPLRSPLSELDEESWDACLRLNLTAVWMASVIAAKRMTDGGSIINISSPAGDRGVPGSGHYAAAKAGVNSLTKTLSLELAPAVRVNGISPGYVPTEVMMTALDTDVEALETMAQKRIPLKRLGTPDDMGSTAVYLASDAGSWMTGQTLIVAGGS